VAQARALGKAVLACWERDTSACDGLWSTAALGCGFAFPITAMTRDYGDLGDLSDTRILIVLFC